MDDEIEPYADEVDSPRQFIEFFCAISSVRVGAFSLTSTQLRKSIVDANEQIRSAFQETGFHNYYLQPSGQAGRVRKDALAFVSGGFVEAELSLYRATSTHDPRLWITQFARIFPLARSGDIILIAQDGQRCVILDASHTEFDDASRSSLASVFSW